MIEKKLKKILEEYGFVEDTKNDYMFESRETDTLDEYLLCIRPMYYEDGLEVTISPLYIGIQGKVEQVKDEDEELTTKLKDLKEEGVKEFLRTQRELYRRYVKEQKENKISERKKRMEKDFK